MSFKGKSVKVIIIGKAKEDFTELNKIVGQEHLKNIRSSDYQTLLHAINQKKGFLETNPQYGTHVEKHKIPKEYIHVYEVNNLWKIDLPKGWRMLYTIKGTDVEIFAIILDIIDHKDYDKKFGYRKR